MLAFPIKIKISLIKILNIREPKTEPWEIPVKISIHLLTAEPIFTFSF